MPLLKCSAGKAKPQAAIGYITNPKKAEIVSVRNLFEDEDYAKQFEQTAAMYGKGKGFNERKYYHFKLSCARQDNLSPQEAHKFAEEVAERLFRDYECVLATHTDTDTVHSHIIVNAVNPLTGNKLQFSPKDYVAMKDEVNRLGKEHGYTETDFRKRGKNSRTAAERKIMLNGGVSWNNNLLESLKATIRQITEVAMQIQTEVSIATAKTTDEASLKFNKRINEAADRAIAKIDELTAETTNKVKSVSKEIDGVKNEIYYELGFRKFFFWATPILLLAQTVVSIFLLLR